MANPYHLGNASFINFIKSIFSIEYVRRIIQVTYNNPSWFYVNIQRDHATPFFEVLTKYSDLLHGKHIIIFTSNGWGHGNNIINEQMKNYTAKHKLNVGKSIIILDTIPSNKYYFLDDHLNKHGHKWLAKQILNLSL